MVSKASQHSHLFGAQIRDDSISLSCNEIEKMTYNENQNLDIDPAMIILGLGYATCLIVGIAWIASLVI
jgi:hypothetical protein